MNDGYNAGVDGSFLGLGFSHRVGNETTPSTNAADSLMKHYLQQCLDFHEEQQQQHQVETSVPQFVTAQHPPAAPPVTTTEQTSSSPTVSRSFIKSSRTRSYCQGTSDCAKVSTATSPVPSDVVSTPRFIHFAVRLSIASTAAACKGTRET